MVWFELASLHPRAWYGMVWYGVVCLKASPKQAHTTPYQAQA